MAAAFSGLRTTGFLGGGTSFSEGYYEKLNLDPPIGMSSGARLVVLIGAGSTLVAEFVMAIPFS